MDMFFGQRHAGRRRPSQSSSSDDDDDYGANEITVGDAGESNEPKQQSKNMQLAIRTVSVAINADNQVPEISSCRFYFLACPLLHFLISINPLPEKLPSSVSILPQVGEKLV